MLGHCWEVCRVRPLRTLHAKSSCFDVETAPDASHLLANVCCSSPHCTGLTQSLAAAFLHLTSLASEKGLVSRSMPPRPPCVGRSLARRVASSITLLRLPLC